MASTEMGDPALGEREKLNEEINKIYQTLTKEEDEAESLYEAEEAEEVEAEVEGGEIEEGEVPLEAGSHEEDVSGMEVAEEDELMVDTGTQNKGGQQQQRSESGNVLEAASLLMNIDNCTASSSPETCLMLNRAYQEALTQTINSIETILAHSRERQKSLEEEIESGMTTRSKMTPREKILANFGVPYFKDARGMHPPPNEDMEAKRQEYNPYEKVSRAWTDSDHSTLTKAVAADSLKKLMQPLMNRKNLELEKLELANTKNEKEPIQCRLDDLETDITRARYTKKEDLYGDLSNMEAIEKIDWMKISAFDFDGAFSESYLRSKWVNHVHPDINKSKWTNQEDEMLACLAEAHRFRNWHTIAALLGTNRSAFQCLQRYQTRLNPCLVMGPWAPEEDDALRNVVETFTFDKYIAWHQVSCYMEGRTREQCVARWEQLNHTNKRGRWTTEEDVRLLAAVHCYGQHWDKVRHFVPGRTATQIRERWQNSLTQDLKYGNWTYEEDRQLILAIEKYGEKWATIAREMKGRTDNMLLQRYKRLTAWKKENEELRALPQGALEIYKSRNLQDEVGSRKKNKAAACKVQRLLEQKKTQEEYREKERNDDLILKVEGTETEENRSQSSEDPAPPDPSTTRQEAPESVVETQEPDPNTNRGPDEVLNLVAKRTYAERQKNWEREKELIEKDLADGIYVPRPPDTNATRVVNYVERRKLLHSAIMKHVHETLKSTAKGDPQVIFECLRRNLESNDLPIGIDEEELSRIFTGPPPTIRDLLNRVDRIKKVKQRLTIESKRDIMRHDDGKTVEMEILKLLRDKNTMKRKVGRPRKHLQGTELNKPITQRSETVEKKIGSLMVSTMNLDKVGAAVMAKAILGKDKSSTSSSNITLYSREEEEEEETEGPIVGEEEMEELKKGMRKKDCKNKFVLVRGIDEYDYKIALRSPADDQANRDVKYLQDLAELEAPNQCPRVYRRNLVGRAERMYHIPPMPPNTTTLRGFKTLMLNRRLLIKNAQNYHKPGTLDGHVAREETGTEDASLLRAMERLEQQIPPQVRECLDSELHLTDLTPQVIRKLKKQFSNKEINAARDVLKRRAELQNAMRVNAKKDGGPVLSAHPPKAADPRTKNRWNLLRKAKTSHDYQLLKARFLSLFLWPAMMSSFELPRFYPPEKDPPNLLSVKQEAAASSPEGTEESPSKRRKRLPLTATKKARKLQVKSKASKQQFQQAMSEIKKNAPPKPRKRKVADGDSAAPRRQSRRLLLKEEKAATEKDSQNHSEDVEGSQINSETIQESQSQSGIVMGDVRSESPLVLETVNLEDAGGAIAIIELQD